MAVCKFSDYVLAGIPRPKRQSPKPFKPSQLHYFSNARFLIPPQSTKNRTLTGSRTTIDVRAYSAERDNMPSDARRRAMDAIDSSRRRINIGGVVRKSSLNSNEAQKAPQALAADTNGFIEVSDEGGVVYDFLKDYRLKLIVKSFRKKIEPLLVKGKMAIVFLVMVSFGMSLAASSVVGLTAMTLASVLTCFQSSEAYPVLRIICDGLGTLCGGRFIEYVFSLVFGDGDPNQGIEEKRWKMIGQKIALNGGVVTAEELAPFLDPETTKKMDDDSYMLPVLLRFDGQPKVDEEGDILYHFPSIQCFAASQRTEGNEHIGTGVDSVIPVQNFLKEKKWVFSKVDDKESEIVIFFLTHNLYWIVMIGAILRGFDYIFDGFFGSSIVSISFLSNIFLPLLRMYAIYVGSFFVIATIRVFIYRKRNVEVSKRNEAREQLAKALELPDLSLKKKILSARSMAGVWNYKRQEWDRRFKERWD